MGNKWGPGCCDCDCPMCSDYYYPPNDWYVYPADFAASAFTSGSSGSGYYSGFPKDYYWSSSDLHTVLNSLVATFQFPGTEPSSTFGSANVYAFPSATFSSATAYATVEMWNGSGWNSQDVEFSAFELQSGAIYNDCTGRYVDFTMDFKALEPATALTQDCRIAFSSDTIYKSCATLPLKHRDYVAVRNNPPIISPYQSYMFATYTGVDTMFVSFPLEISGSSGSTLFFTGKGYVDTTAP